MTKKIVTIIQAMLLLLIINGAACANEKSGKTGSSEAKKDAIAASFPCEKAGTNVEKMICSDAEIASLDVKLDRFYKDALNRSEDKQKLKDEQRAWLEERRNKCGEPYCLASTYRHRIEEFNTYILSRQKNSESSAEGGQTAEIIKEFHELIVGAYQPGSNFYRAAGPLVIMDSSISWNGCDQAPFRILKKIHTNFLIELLDDRYCLVHGDKVTHLNLYAKEGGLGIGVDIFLSRENLERNAWRASGEFGSRKKIN
jgi:uncharacterized protein YecT (DUF1311 family)